MKEVSSKPKTLTYLVRNFIFGVEDSLVSTVGLLSGVAVANVSKSTIILTGLVLIFVEAFSMGVGSFLTEHSVEKYETQSEKASARSLTGAFIMFFSYFLAGFIPLSPYLALETKIAFPLSIVASFVSLFFLGIVSARLFKTSLVRNGVEMLVIGGGAILIGVAVGVFVRE